MPLTISVIAGIALLLPGLFSILFWNVRARKHAASRPDLAITAVSVLTISIAVSMMVHLLAWYFFFACQKLLITIGSAIAGASPRLAMALPGSIENPIETIARLAHGTSGITVEPTAAAAVVLTLLLEIAFVSAVLSDEGFDLLFEGVDLGNQGWVYTHLVRPARNDYRPIAYVVTTLQKDGLGIGFRGMVEDIRQSEKGETLALTLLDPERFLYELKSGQDGGGYGGEATPPQFVRHKEEPVGTIVSIDGKFIQNIVISTPQAERLKRLKALMDASGITLNPREPADG